MQYQDPLYPQNFVCHDDESDGYYALIVENLILIPKEQNIALDLTRCITFPGGEQIPTWFQGLVCTEAPMPVSTKYKTAWVIGKANLTNPYQSGFYPPNLTRVRIPASAPSTTILLQYLITSENTMTTLAEEP